MTSPHVATAASVVDDGDAAPVLLVGPAALPTGASLTLLALLRWTRRALPRPPRAVLLASGPLHRDFQAAGARVLGEPRSPALLAEQVARRLGQPRVATAVRRARHAPVYLRSPRPRVVFASTVQAAGPTLRFLDDRTRLVTYAVEPGDLLDELVNPAMMGRLGRRTFLWVAASDDVAAGLVDRGVPEGRVVVVRPFFDLTTPDPRTVREARARLGAADDRPIVGGVGRSDWRDGPDAFLRMASMVVRRHPDLPVRFLWVGAPEDGPTRWILDHDVRRASLSDVMTFAGRADALEPWVGVFDVLALTSRVDPAPPASLAAGVAGIPTVAFSTRPGAGGNGDCRTTAPLVPLAVDELGSELVPYLDVEAMAERIATLIADPDARAAAGAVRQTAVGALGSVDEQAAALWEILEISAERRPRREGATP